MDHGRRQPRDVSRWRARPGANVLTHLLGQTLDELVEKVAVYRRAWRAGGHGESGGRVTLMLHTFVGDVGRCGQGDRARADEALSRQRAQPHQTVRVVVPGLPANAPRQLVRPPTRSSSSSRRKISTALLEHAFERYYETSGLFGTPETCVAMIDRVKAAGIEEVACLIDFGVPHDEVVGSFERDWRRLRALVAEARPVDADDHSIPIAHRTAPGDAPAVHAVARRRARAAIRMAGLRSGACGTCSSAARRFHARLADVARWRRSAGASPTCTARPRRPSGPRATA